MSDEIDSAQLSATEIGATETAAASGGVADVTRARSGQARLIWWSFRKHKLAMISAAILILIMFVMVFAEFLAPKDPQGYNEYNNAPPQMLHIGDNGDGWGLYVEGYNTVQNPDTLRITQESDSSQKIPVGFFVKGPEYKMFGLISWDRHLIGPKDADQPFHLLGTNRNGKDVYSQLVYATRISMSVGLIGVLLSFVLGVTLGAVSGYFGGASDNIIQRFTEFIQAVPSIPLWLALAAAFPIDMSPVTRYFLITTILAVIAWTSLSREVRGRFMALRNEDFVTSALLDGSSRRRVMFRHMLPSVTSHLIAAMTLSVPLMIIGETTLSWLGLGLVSPAVSWGVQLQDATSVVAIDQTPWVLFPGLAVVVTVLALNFVGDGLRDAADPYKH